MLLTIDIGNTNIALGVFEGERLIATWHLATDVHKLADEYAAIMLELLPHSGLDFSHIEEAIICSVVPPLVTTFEKLCRHYLRVSPMVVGSGIKTGVRIRMENPREVGPDRVVNAAAGYRLYGGPLIIIDFGTATTFDIISQGGDYLGGAIAPGVMVAAEGLFQSTARLPRVELVCPKRAIGKNTVSAMQSGIIFGYVGLVEGLVARLKQELGGEVRVIATGSLAQLIAAETEVIEGVNLDLTLEGLRLIHRLNSKAEN
jgi:type III pantothenate kinase